MESPEVQKKIEAWLETRIGAETPQEVKDRISSSLRSRITKQKVCGLAAAACLWVACVCMYAAWP